MLCNVNISEGLIEYIKKHQDQEDVVDKLLSFGRFIDQLFYHDSFRSVVIIKKKDGGYKIESNLFKYPFN
jgi:hypothetical protein